MTEGERIAERLRQLQEEGSLERALGTSPNDGEDRSMMQRVGDGARRVALNTVAPPFGIAKQVLDYAENNDVGLAGRTGIGALQGASMGGLARLASGGETLDQAMQGNLLSGEERAANREKYRGVVEENSNLGGELAGAVLTGGGAMRGVAEGAKQNVPRLFNYINRTFAGRAGATASMSALEAAAYTLNEGGTLDDAQTAAIWGAGFGVGGSAVGHVLGPLVNAVKGSLGYRADINASTALVQSLKNMAGEDALRIGPRGETLIDEAYIAAQAARFGPDASMADIVPDAVTSQVSNILSSSSPKVYEAALPLVRFLQNRQQTAQPEFRQAVRQIIDTDNFRSAGQVRADRAATNAQISDQYTQVIDRATNNGIMFKASNARRMVENAFRKSDTPMNRDMRDRLLDMIGEPTTIVGKGRNAREVPRELSVNELMEIRSAMDKAIYSGAMPGLGSRQSVANIDNVVRSQYMQPARDGINRMLHHRVGGLRQLDSAYSSEAVNEAAYTIGGRLFRSARPDVAEFNIFMNDPSKTPQQMESFLEGVKEELFRKLDGRTTPRQIQNVLDENRPAFQALEAVLEPEQVEALQQAVHRYAMAVNSGNMLKPTPAGNDVNRNPVGQLADWIIAGSGLSGTGSIPATQGALRRQAMQGMLPPGQLGTAQANANLLSAPAGEAAGQANEAVSNSLPLLTRYYPNAAALYGFAGAQTGQ